MEPTVELPLSVAKGIATYLGKKPWEEVQEGMPALLKAIQAAIGAQPEPDPDDEDSEPQSSA